MKTLAELRAALESRKKAALDILNLADKEGRDLTDAETTAYEGIEDEIDAIKADIDKAEKMAERRRSMEAVALPSVPAGHNRVDDPNPATTGGFRDIAEFASAVRNASRPGGGVVDGRLMAAPTNFHTGGAASGEGYEVPAEFRDGIWEVVMETEDLLPLVDLEPTSAREVKLMSDETTPWGTSGITASWRSEGSQMTANKLSQEPRSVPLHELYVFALATEELLEDAPRLAARITRKAGLAMSWKISDSIIYGNGAGQPLGWFNSGALVSVAKEGSQAADTIVAENVLKMYSRLLRMPGDMPFWLANSDILPELGTMTIGDQPAWLPNNSGMQGAPDGTLLGVPVRFSEHAKTLGDKGDITLVSPKGYYAARRTQGVQFASSMHLFFDYATEAFRWMFRFGGQPHLSAPVSPANGSSTKSHFVTLDERT